MYLEVCAFSLSLTYSRNRRCVWSSSYCTIIYDNNTTAHGLGVSLYSKCNIPPLINTTPHIGETGGLPTTRRVVHFTRKYGAIHGRHVQTRAHSEKYYSDKSKRVLRDRAWLGLANRNVMRARRGVDNYNPVCVLSMSMAKTVYWFANALRYVAAFMAQFAGWIRGVVIQSTHCHPTILFW